MQISIDRPYFLLDHMAQLSVKAKKVGKDSWELEFSQPLPYAKSFIIQGRTDHLRHIVESLNKILVNSH